MRPSYQFLSILRVRVIISPGDKQWHLYIYHWNERLSTFNEREFHRGLCCEVKSSFGLTIVTFLLLGQSGNLRGVLEDRDIRDGEDANAGIPLPLIQVVVHLLLDVDYVSLAETELTTVLRLETEQGLGDHLAIGGLLSSVQENC